MATSTFEATHKGILECGKAQFLKNGYEGTSLRELCKTVGITTGSFYRHFTDKEALFSALVENTTSGLKDLLRDCLEKGYDLTAKCPEIFYKEHYQRDIPTLLNYIYGHFDIFRLLALCGHKYCFRDFIRELAMLETKYAKESQQIFGPHFLFQMKYCCLSISLFTLDCLKRLSTIYLKIVWKN